MCGGVRGIVKWMTKFIFENKSELETGHIDKEDVPRAKEL
jgi:hypothetical protein